MDSFAAYAYTPRILNAYPVANKRVDNPQRTTRAKRLFYIVFSLLIQRQGEIEGKL